MWWYSIDPNTDQSEHSYVESCVCPVCRVVWSSVRRAEVNSLHGSGVLQVRPGGTDQTQTDRLTCAPHNLLTRFCGIQMQRRSKLLARISYFIVLLSKLHNCSSGHLNCCLLKQNKTKNCKIQTTMNYEKLLVKLRVSSCTLDVRG